MYSEKNALIIKVKPLLIYGRVIICLFVWLSSPFPRFLFLYTSDLIYKKNFLLSIGMPAKVNEYQIGFLIQSPDPRTVHILDWITFYPPSKILYCSLHQPADDGGLIRYRIIAKLLTATYLFLWESN